MHVRGGCSRLGKRHGFRCNPPGLPSGERSLGSDSRKLNAVETLDVSAFPFVTQTRLSAKQKLSGFLSKTQDAVCGDAYYQTLGCVKVFATKSSKLATGNTSVFSQIESKRMFRKTYRTRGLLVPCPNASLVSVSEVLQSSKRFSLKLA